VTKAMNWFFTAASGLVLPFVGALVMAKVPEPRLGQYAPGTEDPESGDARLTDVQRKGLWRTTAVLAVYAVIVVGAWVLPAARCAATMVR
jgi:aminobenzoyl-glutamate transport protein